MTAAQTLDLAPAAILARAANLIATEGHTKGDFITGEGYCAAGAISEACGLRAEDWYDDREFAPSPADYTVDGDFDDVAYEADCRSWKEGRRAALAALRTLAARVDSDCRPEEMTRQEVLEVVSGWNDHDEDSDAEQVISEMRAAAGEAAAS